MLAAISKTVAVEVEANVDADVESGRCRSRHVRSSCSREVSRVEDVEDPYGKCRSRTFPVRITDNSLFTLVLYRRTTTSGNVMDIDDVRWSRRTTPMLMYASSMKVNTESTPKNANRKPQKTFVGGTRSLNIVKYSTVVRKFGFRVVVLSPGRYVVLS